MIILEVEEILKGLEDTLQRAWKLPLTGGKALVNVEKILELLHSLEESLPKEFTQAKNIVADRQKILSDAKEESKKMLQTTEEKIKLMLSRDELMKKAKEVAEALVKESRNEAKAVKKATSSYVDDMMRDVEKALADGIVNIRELRKKLKGIKSDEN
jgi:vacuolar-type H+-ATPase subunit H